jgi:biotin carboxyl carrier protein
MSTQSPPSRAAQRQADSVARHQRADRSELAVSTTSPDWDGRPHHRRLPRLTSLLLVLGLLAVIAIIAVTQITRRLNDRDIVQVRQAVLTADPIGFDAATAGRLIEVRVKEGDSVTVNQVIGVIEYADPPGDIDVPTNVEILAPADGVISDVNVSAGEFVRGGKDMMTMYQPGQMYFEVPMTYKDAAKLRVGMAAEFEVPGIGTIKGSVVGIQSDFGDAGAEDVERLAKVVVRPDDVGGVSNIAPGIVTDGEIDKSTAPADAPSAIFAER